MYHNKSDSCVMHCDSKDKGAMHSPDWLGAGWYRFTGGAGDMMADTPPWNVSCCSGVAGWMEGKLPSVMEGEVINRICFSYAGEHCWRENVATVVNCGEYFLYYLDDVPNCYYRYCGQDMY